MDDLLPDCESVVSAALRGLPPADTDASLILLFAALQALREAELPAPTLSQAGPARNAVQGQAQAVAVHSRQNATQAQASQALTSQALVSQPHASKPHSSQPQASKQQASQALPSEMNTPQPNGVRAAQASPPRGSKRRATAAHRAA